MFNFPPFSKWIDSLLFLRSILFSFYCYGTLCNLFIDMGSSEPSSLQTKMDKNENVYISYFRYLLILSARKLNYQPKYLFKLLCCRSGGYGDGLVHHVAETKLIPDRKLSTERSRGGLNEPENSADAIGRISLLNQKPSSDRRSSPNRKPSPSQRLPPDRKSSVSSDRVELKFQGGKTEQKPVIFIWIVLETKVHLFIKFLDRMNWYRTKLFIFLGLQ